MRLSLMLTAGAVLLVLFMASSSCSTTPGGEEEAALIQKAIDEGEDPLDAIYKANMTLKAGERTTARMMLELVKQVREQNRILADISNELRSIYTSPVQQ